SSKRDWSSDVCSSDLSSIAAARGLCWEEPADRILGTCDGATGRNRRWRRRLYVGPSTNRGCDALMRLLLATRNLSYDNAMAILDTAQEMATVSARSIKKLPTLRGQT